jgi:hypothetical protein
MNSLNIQSHTLLPSSEWTLPHIIEQNVTLAVRKFINFFWGVYFISDMLFCYHVNVLNIFYAPSSVSMFLYSYTQAPLLYFDSASAIVQWI